MKKPLTYLFVGSSGRLGSHLVRYFEQLSQKSQPHSSRLLATRPPSDQKGAQLTDSPPSTEFAVLTWSRGSAVAEANCKIPGEFIWDQKLFEMAQKATHIWLCLPDHLIEAAHLKLTRFLNSQTEKSPIFIHSSGAWSFQKIFSAHPLMSFRSCNSKEELYPFTTYLKMSFAVTFPKEYESSETKTSDLQASELKALLFPFLPNSIFYLPQEQKALYHACCVLGANGVILLWQKFFGELLKLGTPLEGLQIFIKQVCENFLENPALALTGPLVRKDQKTLELDAKALSHDPYLEIFESFAKLKIKSTGLY
jgi:hypothetical protein